MPSTGLSPSQFLAWQGLVRAMEQARKEVRGVKIHVAAEQVDLLKRAFYKVRKDDCQFTSLSLLATADPEVFLLYHLPQEPEEINNGN